MYPAINCLVGQVFGLGMQHVSCSVLQAIERGEGSGSDWSEFEQRLKQAESDAVTFEAARQQALEAKKVS